MGKPLGNKVMTAREAVQAHVFDGATIGMGGQSIGRNSMALAHEIVKKGLNVRQTEKLVQDAKAGAGMKRIKKAVAEKDPDTRALEQRLGDSLGLKVDIAVKDGADGGETGKITIHFNDFDQLDEVAERLSAARAAARQDVEM